MQKLKIHPVCKIFPDISDDEFQKLKADIEEHGQREPIIVRNGYLLDGKNRLRACTELGIEPNIEEWKGNGESLVAWSVSKNLRRRHLSESQRAALAAELAELYAKERKMGRNSQLPPDGGKTSPVQAAAKAAGASERSTERARAVKNADPKAFAQVKAGKKTVTTAERESRQMAANEPAAEPEVITDKVGNVLPERFHEAFTSREITEVCSAIQAIRKRVKELCATPIGAHLHHQTADAILENAMQTIKHSRPHALCGYCRATGKSCKACKKQGWITKPIYDAAPEDVKGAQF